MLIPAITIKSVQKDVSATLRPDYEQNTGNEGQYLYY
jgi:hypothetical protein